MRITHGTRGGRELQHFADAVHVPGDEMAVERIGELKRRLEVHPRADAEPAEGRHAERFGRQVDREAVAHAIP